MQDLQRARKQRLQRVRPAGAQQRRKRQRPWTSRLPARRILRTRPQTWPTAHNRLSPKHRRKKAALRSLSVDDIHE